MERFETIGEKVTRLMLDFVLWGALAVVGIGSLVWCAHATAAELTPAAVKDSASSPGGEVVVVRFEDSCAHPGILKVIQRVPPQYRDKFKSGVGMFEGKPYRHCWIEEYGLVVILWEDETMTRFPAHLFKKRGDAV